MSKKVPLRLCLGCRRHLPKNELVRIVKSPEGEVSIDYTGKMPGRGAYVCNNADCIKKAIKSNALARVFKTRVSEEILNKLQNEKEI